MLIPTGSLSWQREIPPSLPTSYKVLEGRCWLVPRDPALLGATEGGGQKQQERHAPQGAFLGQDVSSLHRPKDGDGGSLGGYDIST